jgi:hypothetical protein
MMRFRQGIRTLDKIPNGHSYAIGCFQKIAADYIRARNANEPDAYLKAITDIVTFQPTFLDRDKNEHKAEAWIRSIYEEAKAHIEKAEGPAAERHAAARRLGASSSSAAAESAASSSSAAAESTAAACSSSSSTTTTTIGTRRPESSRIHISFRFRLAEQ